MDISRRGFLKISGGAAAGLAVGGLTDLGLNLSPIVAHAQELRIRKAKAVPSVCPYCAVGCGQIVHVQDGKIVNIEGNPDSPVNQGNLCPKGAATYQLAVNPLRITKVLYRAPYSDRWEEKPLDWAMDQIAQRTKKTRDETFATTWKNPVTGEEKVINHTLGIASLGGATIDNEENYLIKKLMCSLGVVYIENQARI